MSKILPSNRAMANVQPDLLESLENEVRDQRNKGNDVIDLSGSVNRLMARELEDYAQKNIKIDFRIISSYQTSETVATLKDAISTFISTHFHPSKVVEPSHLVVTNGVTSLLNVIGFATCEAQEGILCTTPMYNEFRPDLASRNNVRLVEVPVGQDVDQFAASSAETLIATLEAARRSAHGAGIVIKALLICNPSNPLGRCYSRPTLIALAIFCARYNLHLISDEIYAMSVFPSQATGQDGDGHADGFTSTLAICHEPGVNIDSIHVLYGASKDFGLGGLRLGILITRNNALHAVCNNVRTFSGISSFSAALFTALLADTTYIGKYILKYQHRLQKNYLRATTFLHEHNIPFDNVNAGLFLWVDLSRWLQQSSSQDSDEKESVDIVLARRLIKNGIYIRPGKVFSADMAGHFRVGYTYGEITVMAGLERLVKGLNEL